MKTSFLVCLSSLAYSALFAAAPDAARILATSPLRFEPGAGDQPSQFLARGIRSRFVFERNAVQVAAADKNIRFEFAGANPHARLEGVDKLRSATGVFIGNDPTQWRRAIPNYGRLQVHELYGGVDLVYYGNGGELEYDLRVKPGADPRSIRLAFPGSHPILDASGNLDAGLVLKHPVAYQIAGGGAKIPVASRFRKNSDGTYGFALGRYDRGRELVIDPVLTLKQFIGGSSQDIGYAIGHDANGFLYVAGTTYSSDFPTAGAAAGNPPRGGEDLFIAKINPNADPSSQIVYAGFIGGSANDALGAMVVDPSGRVYLTGNTASSDFPTVSAAQSTLNGTTDAFVMQLDIFETPIYSTYLGGSGIDVGNGIALDSKGRIWVTGGTQSDDFPIAGGFQTGRTGSQDVFVAGIDPAQSGSGSLIYSTYMGGTWWDTGRGIAAAPDGTVWVVGGTYSYDFPVAGNSFQPNYQSGGDAFIAQINPVAGRPLAYSTYFGGGDLEEARNVLVDANGRVIVSGYTLSRDFPVTDGAPQTRYGGNTDLFISILNPANSAPPAGQLAFSTYFGGSNPDVSFDLKMDGSGNLYLAGFTTSASLPSSGNALQSSYDGSMDAFVLKLDPSKSGSAAISYFSYLGGSGLQIAYGVDFDNNGNIYLTGFTTGPLFDVLGGPGKGTASGNPDGFVIGFSTQQ